MFGSETALVVVDAQESFRHRAYWTDRDVPMFVERLQALVDGAKARGVPVVQVFHVEEAGPFSLESGFVTALEGLSIEPATPVIKHGQDGTKLTVRAADDAALGHFTIELTGHPAKGPDATALLKVRVRSK